MDMCRGIERLIENVDSQVESIWEILLEQKSIQSRLVELNNQHRAYDILKRAYLDIDGLLQEGFDTNAKDCQISGVKDTLEEIRDCVKAMGGREL